MPFVESPFFKSIFTPEAFSESEIAIAKDLSEKGYAVIDFPDPDLALRADAIKHALHHRYAWAQWKADSADMRVQDAWKFDDNVRAICTNKAIIDLLTRLYGRQAWPFQSLSFPVGTQQHFHTDAVHFSSVPERFMCGVWVAFEDIGPDQGPLQYFPGSHRWPFYGNEHIGFTPTAKDNDQKTYEPLWRELVAHSEIPQEQFLAKKGQALIWAANLLHGGMPHLDKTQTRWSQVTHYFFDDCLYYTPMLSDAMTGVFKTRQPMDIGVGRERLRREIGEAHSHQQPLAGQLPHDCRKPNESERNEIFTSSCILKGIMGSIFRR